jgi:hypothetical protein
VHGSVVVAVILRGEDFVQKASGIVRTDQVELEQNIGGKTSNQGATLL